MSTSTEPHGTTASLNDPIDPETINLVAAGRHGAPFDVLGPHRMTIQGQPVWIVRVFRPDAAAISIVPHPSAAKDNHATGKPDAQHLTMRKIHPAGLFSVVVPGVGFPDYQLEVQHSSGDVQVTADPYALPPIITDYDLYLMGEGRHFELFDRLGAHPMVHNRAAGVEFAVWAPNARRVSVVGDFNGWDERVYPMRLRSNGIWEIFIPGVSVGALYKYAILSWNHEYRVLKADPFAFAAELRPGTASRVWDLAGYEWGDSEWLNARANRDPLQGPISVYEVHLGSWRPASASSGGGLVSYRDLAHELVAYVKDLGYTHIELLPVAEHPFDGSWGYQVTGYFAPTSRYGTPQDFMYFVDYCHQHDIGVIMDWVPAHFPRDEHGLRLFDGSHLYEHDDPRKGEHPDWGTLVFNYGRNEVRNFLIANALFWLGRYHIDGLRVDAVASMLYLDYSREPGQWVPNPYGGRENLDAVRFLQECNTVVAEQQPHTLMIAEESTAWPRVTAAPQDGGLGFSLKWNMGWMHDILDYISRDPVHRKYHHNELTFSMMYAYSERFILPFSHDEVVHLKRSMLDKMPGDIWQKFANLRALYAYMYGHPGKKHLFMGGEFGQWTEWNHAGFLDWGLLDPRNPEVVKHRQLCALVRDLNELLRRHSSLYALDFDPAGFEWIDGSDAAQSVISFIRYGADKSDLLLFVCNFTPVPRYNYRIGAPLPGLYETVLNSDSVFYGGSNVGQSHVATDEISSHGRAQSLSLTLPPLATIILQPVRR